jgi:ABC-type dipeptide/oligopeptide/nickel transport system ATPase component
VSGLKTWFSSDEGVVRAVDGVSFEIPKGKTFALVGESGCGKSMTALSIMKLVPQPAGRIVSGHEKTQREASLNHFSGTDDQLESCHDDWPPN